MRMESPRVSVEAHGSTSSFHQQHLEKSSRLGEARRGYDSPNRTIDQMPYSYTRSTPPMGIVDG